MTRSGVLQGSRGKSGFPLPYRLVLCQTRERQVSQEAVVRSYCFFVLPRFSPRISLEKHSSPAAQASGRKAIHRSTQCSSQSCSGPETCACNLEEDRQRLHNLLGQTEELIQGHRFGFHFNSCKIKAELMAETPPGGQRSL